MKYQASDPQNPVNDWQILIIDDTPDNIAVAKAALEFHGANVYTANSGAEGLATLKTIQPNVILLDIRMPSMDGWQVFEMIRKVPAYQNITIIAITAYAMEKDRANVLAKGFDGYMSKPFDILTFVHDIEKINNRAVAKRQLAKSKHENKLAED